MKRNDLSEQIKKKLKYNYLKLTAMKAIKNYFSCDILILVGENSEYVSQSIKLNQVLSTKASDKVL